MSHQEKINALVNKLKNIDENYLDKVISTLNKDIDKFIFSYSKKEKHKTIRLEHPDGGKINIDKDISELIDNLWKLDLMTYNSCQNNYLEGYIWIEFTDYANFMCFMNMIFMHTNPNIHDRIFYPHSYMENIWYYRINHMDADSMEKSDSDSGSDETNVLLPPGFSVRFPRSDYQMVLEIVKIQNMKNEIEKLSK